MYVKDKNVGQSLNIVTANRNIPWDYLSERPVTVWLISYIGIFFQYVLETRFNKGNFQKKKTLQKHVNWAGREQIKIPILKPT